MANQKNNSKTQKKSSAEKKQDEKLQAMTSAQRKAYHRDEQEKAKREEEARMAKAKEAASASSIKEEQKAEDKLVPARVGLVETGAGGVLVERKNVWILLTAAILSVILIAFAVLIPTVIYPHARFSAIFNRGNSVAVLHLSTGDQIEIEVFESIAPRASTNFLHLASIGFFDNVIVFDNSGWLRFGQYENVEFTEFRTQNDEFIESVRNITNTSENRRNRPFDYRLHEDNTPEYRGMVGGDAGNFARNFGYISLIQTLSGVDFQIAGEGNPATHLVNRSPTAQFPSQNMQGFPFGRVLTAPQGRSASEEALSRITDNTQTPQNFDAHPIFVPPQNTIYIRRVRIYRSHYSFWNKWRTFNWDNFFNDEFAVGGRLVTWFGTSGNI